MKKPIRSTQKNQPMSPNESFETHKSSANGIATTDAVGLIAEDITEIIVKDHRPLKVLIKTLKNDEIVRTDKEEILEDFVVLLLAHAKAEEQTLYVAMKDYEPLKILSFEGDTEHFIADQLVQEINASPNDFEWLAKVKILAEMVEHHVDDEEKEILVKVKEIIPEIERFIIGAEYNKLISEFRMLNFYQVPRQVKYNIVHNQLTN